MNTFLVWYFTISNILLWVFVIKLVSIQIKIIKFCEVVARNIGYKNIEKTINIILEEQKK